MQNFASPAIAQSGVSLMPSHDPDRAKQQRREYYLKLRERDPDYQKRMYAKHKEKRLAAKREAYAADPEKMRARKVADYAKHREKRAEAKRQHRAENRAQTNAESLASYHRNRDKRRERKRTYYVENYDKIYAKIQEWRKRNPDRELLYHAKRLLTEATGIPTRSIPDELVEAKVAQILVHRAAQGIPTGTAETPAAPFMGSPVGNADAPGSSR